MCRFVSIETIYVTSTLTYNFWNTADTNIKYVHVLVECFESAKCFLESIKFYEHVEVLLKFKFLSYIITNVLKVLRGNPALDHDNKIHEYDISGISRHVRYCAFLKKTK